MDDSLIALFEFEQNNDRISIVTEKHYRLVAPESISKSEKVTNIALYDNPIRSRLYTCFK